MSLYLDFVPLMAGADGTIAGPAGRRPRRGRDAAPTSRTSSRPLADRRRPRRRELRRHGPRGAQLGEIAATLAAASGKPITYKDETLAEARASRAHYGAPDWQVEAWISTYTAIAAGEVATVSDTVERLAGHPPQTLAEYLRAHPDALDHVASLTSALQTSVQLPTTLFSARRTGSPRLANGALRRKEVRMSRIRCLRCLRLWFADRVENRASCPFCGGALDQSRGSHREPGGPDGRPAT